MIVIRQATEADLPALLEIYNHIIVNTTAVWHDEPHTIDMRKEWLQQRTKDGFPVFVAMEDNQMLGFSSIGPFRAWPGYRFTVENSIYIAEHSRRKGIANLLMPPLINVSIKLNLHAIVAGIEASNTASIALHKKFGFEQVAHFKEVGFKFDRWLDLIFMELILTKKTAQNKKTE